MPGPIKGFINTFTNPARGLKQGSQRTSGIVTSLHHQLWEFTRRKGKPMSARQAKEFARGLIIPAGFGLLSILFAPSIGEQFAGLVVVCVWLFFVVASFKNTD